jgi:hypothetical protein
MAAQCYQESGRFAYRRFVHLRLVSRLWVGTSGVWCRSRPAAFFYGEDKWMSLTYPATSWSAPNDGGRRCFRIRPPGGQTEESRESRRRIAQANRPKASSPSQRRSGRTGTVCSDRVCCIEMSRADFPSLTQAQRMIFRRPPRSHSPPVWRAEWACVPGVGISRRSPKPKQRWRLVT